MEVKLDLAGMTRQKELIGHIHVDLMSVSVAMAHFGDEMAQHASMVHWVGKVDLIHAELERYSHETVLLERVMDDAVRAYTLMARAMEQRADVLDRRISGYDTRLDLMTHFIPPPPCVDLQRIHERLASAFADESHAWWHLERMTTAPLLKSDGGVLPDWLVDQARNTVGKGISVNVKQYADSDSPHSQPDRGGGFPERSAHFYAAAASEFLASQVQSDSTITTEGFLEKLSAPVADEKNLAGLGVPYVLDDWFRVDVADAVQFAGEGQPVIVLSEGKKDTGSGIRLLVPKSVGDIPEIHAVTEIADEDGSMFYVHA